MAIAQAITKVLKQKNDEIAQLKSKIELLENHGLNRYIKHKCRCEICRAAKAESMRRYNDKKRAAQSAIA